MAAGRRAAGSPQPTPAGWTAAAFLAAVALAIIAVALTAPPDLQRNNEHRLMAYVWDAADRGHWLVQVDSEGELATKPPLYTWLASLAALVLGPLSPIAVYLPTLAAFVATAWVLCAVGRARSGWAAGLLAGLTWLLSHGAGNHLIMARYDGLFAFTVLLCALAAFRAWSTGRGWTWFWLAAAAATMVKGPLGAVLGAAGLLAVAWERRSGTPAPLRGSHRAGVALFLLITGGWFLLAWREAGWPFVDRLILQELFGHAAADQDGPAGSGFHKPALAFLVEFAPWSVFTAVGLWRVWARPSAVPEARRFERFLACFLLVGVVLFSLGAHQRGRLLLPLLPPAALLAGREMARLVAGWRPAAVWRAAAAMALVAVAAWGVVHHVVRPAGRGVVATGLLRQAAAQIRARVGDGFPLAHVDSPFPLRLYLGSTERLISPAEAAALLRAPTPAFVAVGDLEGLKRELGPDAPPVHQLARWSWYRGRDVTIVSNHPRLEWTERIATTVTPFHIEMEGVRLSRVHAEAFEFRRIGSRAVVTVINESDVAREVVVRVTGGPAPDRSSRKRLGAGERWDHGS